MVDIIVLPNHDGMDSTGANKKYKFGYYETMNSEFRSEQEDGLAWHVLTQKDLSNNETILDPIDIAHRLWTTYQALDVITLTGGTTASTTIYDGKGHLITATLADAAAFAVVYDKNGIPLGVRRLNSETHKLTNPCELDRIQKAGGIVRFNRINGRLAVSRAIGDLMYKSKGVCSEAQIDIYHVNQIIKELKIDPGQVGKIQIITTCDGFTDGAHSEIQEVHEQYLLNCINKIKLSYRAEEDVLAKELVSLAKADGSTDNITVAVQTLINNCAILIGIYDGHSGKGASSYVAQNIGVVFKEQCLLSPEAYAKQKLSVIQKKAEYTRDNNDEQMKRRSVIAFEEKEDSDNDVEDDILRECNPYAFFYDVSDLQFANEDEEDPSKRNISSYQ